MPPTVALLHYLLCAPAAIEFFPEINVGTQL